MSGQAKIDQHNRLDIAVPLLEKATLPLFPLMLLGNIISVYRYLEYGSSPLVLLQQLCFIVTYAVLFTRKRYPPLFRLLIYSFGVLLQGMIGLVLWGFLGNGLLLLVLALTLISIAGIRYFLLTFTASSLFVIAVATAYIKGSLQVTIDPLAYMASTLGWMLAFVGMLLAAFAALLWDRLFKDLTERSLALSESEHNYREIFSSTNDAIFIHHAETGEIIDVNDTMLEMYGYSRAEALKLSVGDISAPEKQYAQEVALHAVNVSASGIPQLFEWAARRKNGELFPVEIALKQAYIGGQKRVLAVVRDISERKKAEKEKAHIEQQMRQIQKMESIGQLASGIAHDFNNILQAIKGCAQLGILKTDPAHPAYQRFQEIDEVSDKAVQLVRQLLTFSRKQVLQKEPIDLNEAIGDMIKILGRVIPENIAISFHPGDITGVVIADRGMLEQVVMNLCVNARDAMPGGGALSIETKEITVSDEFTGQYTWAIPGDYAVLQITDTGIGMNSETLSHIFEPFFTTKEKDKGTGLGLATVYGIIRQHNGMITVYSEEGEGTAFKIYLPLTADEKKRAVKAKGCEVCGGSETILIAEDDPMVCRLATQMLEQAGYAVIAAPDGAAAVQLAGDHSKYVDLLLLDLIMPKLGGKEAHQLIQQHRAGIPVIYTSGYSEKSEKAVFAGEEDALFLQKPYTREDLLRAVRTTLDRSKK